MTHDECLTLLEAECAAAISGALSYGGRSHAVSEVAELVWEYMRRYPDLLPPDPAERVLGAGLIQAILEKFGV